MKPLKLKINSNPAKTDFDVKDYKDGSSKVVIVGKNNFTGSVSVNVVVK